MSLKVFVFKLVLPFGWSGHAYSSLLIKCLKGHKSLGSFFGGVFTNVLGIVFLIIFYFPFVNVFNVCFYNPINSDDRGKKMSSLSLGWSVHVSFSVLSNVWKVTNLINILPANIEHPEDEEEDGRRPDGSSTRGLPMDDLHWAQLQGRPSTF